MTELVYLCTRWAHQICSLLAFGSLGFILLADADRNNSFSRWHPKALRFSLLVIVVAAVSGILVLLAQLATLPASDLSSTQLLARLLERSRFGLVWKLREAVLGCALVLIALTCVPSLARHRRGVILVGWFFTGASLLAAPFSGHSAAAEPAWPALSAHALHLLAAGLWLGALPLLTSMVVFAANNSPARTDTLMVLQRFSTLALPAMLIVVVSGLWIGIVHVETFPALLGTTYGYILLGKVFLLAAVLIIASRLRWQQLPRLQAGSDNAHDFARWARAEWLIALTVAALAVWLAQTIPARHDDIAWRLPFRISLEASWDTPWMKEISLVSLALVFIGLAMVGIATRSRTIGRKLAITGVSLVLTATITGVWATAVEAYPGTYWRPSVPYQTISVAAGASLFQTHCVSCHGDSAHGDGPAAKSLPLPPADLTEPHTAYHTAGDIFWWLTYGKPPGAMPGFAHALSEDDRWDLINYLRVLSDGYQARIIKESVVPQRPWLGAVDFNYTDQTGRFETLKDQREYKVVLLVLFTPEKSRQRLETLSRINHEIESAGGIILAVPVEHNNTVANNYPFRVVDEGAHEAIITYSLMRRTLFDADARDANPVPEHMELLIDRYGYVRARWLPSQSEAWNNSDKLLRQIATLATESKVLEPPDDHVH